MLELVMTKKFERDLKRAKKRGLNLEKLTDILELLLNEEPLEKSALDHALSGAYQGMRECHIQPDWLLIYAVDREKLVLVAARTGTHSDLFK